MDGKEEVNGGGIRCHVAQQMHKHFQYDWKKKKQCLLYNLYSPSTLYIKNSCVFSYRYNWLRVTLHVIPGCRAGLGCLQAQALPPSWDCHGCVFQPLVRDPAAHPGLLFVAAAFEYSLPAAQALSPERTLPGPSLSTHPSTRTLRRNKVVGSGTSESVSVLNSVSLQTCIKKTDKVIIKTQNSLLFKLLSHKHCTHVHKDIRFFFGRNKKC